MDPVALLQQLLAQLSSRQSDLERIGAYHAGAHRLAFTSEKFRQAFGGLFSSFSDNFLPLVVDAVEERLNVQGFRYGSDPSSDQDAWDIWQASNLDALSQIAHRESLIYGDSFAIVWPDANGQPKVTVESATQCIVAYATGDRTTRVAAAKSWTDFDGDHAILYTPAAVYRYAGAMSQTRNQVGQVVQELTWSPDQQGDPTWPLPNPLGVVPMVPLTNQPSLTTPFGRSEFLDVIPMQDALNKFFADALVASEYIAFPQRWATGLEIVRDDQGNVIAPFNAGLDKIIQSEDPEARFGTLDAGSPDYYIKMVEAAVQHIAIRTRTPPHYFNVGGNLPSGDAIKSAETGLVSKAKRKMVFYGEAWEEVIRLCFKVLDDPRSTVTNGETIWANPEYRSESELADALVKRVAIGVPREQLWEDAGYSPTQIARFKAMELEDSLDPLFEPVGVPSLPKAPLTTEN